MRERKWFFKTLKSGIKFAIIEAEKVDAYRELTSLSTWLLKASKRAMLKLLFDESPTVWAREDDGVDDQKQRVCGNLCHWIKNIMFTLLLLSVVWGLRLFNLLFFYIVIILQILQLLILTFFSSAVCYFSVCTQSFGYDDRTNQQQHCRLLIQLSMSTFECIKLLTPTDDKCSSRQIAYYTNQKLQLLAHISTSSNFRFPPDFAAATAAGCQLVVTFWFNFSLIAYRNAVSLHSLPHSRIVWSVQTYRRLRLSSHIFLFLSELCGNNLPPHFGRRRLKLEFTIYEKRLREICVHTIKRLLGATRQVCRTW